MPIIDAMDQTDINALRAEVASRKGQWAAIARLGDFDYSWVLRFSDGSIAEPRLSRLEKLREVLQRLPADPRPQ
jgi:hypothetical protein